MKKIWLIGLFSIAGTVFATQELFDFETPEAVWHIQGQGMKASISPEEESKIGNGSLKVETPASKGRFIVYSSVKPLGISPDAAYLSFYVNVPAPTVLVAVLKARQYWVATFKISRPGWQREHIPFTDFVNDKGENILRAGELNQAERLQFTIVKDASSAQTFYFDEIAATEKHVPLKVLGAKRQDDLLFLDFHEKKPFIKPFQNPERAPVSKEDAELGKILRVNASQSEGVMLTLPEKVSGSQGSMEILLRNAELEKMPKRSCRYLGFSVLEKYGTSQKTVWYLYKDELGNLNLSLLVGRYKGTKDVNIGVPVPWKNGQWHTAAVSWNKEKIRLFVDGKKMREAELSSDMFPDGLPFGKEFQLIGAIDKTGHFIGDLGCFRISGECRETFPLMTKE